MELRYHIQESEHIRFTQARRRIRALTPFSLTVTALLVVFPLLVPAYGAYAKVLTGPQLLVVTIIAVALSGCNFFVRSRSWSKKPPKKYARSLAAEFWTEPHILTANSDGVKLRCGEEVREYPWQSFGGFEEQEGLLAPVFNSQYIDLIPLHELEKAGGSEAFQDTIVEMAKDNLRKNVKKAAAAAENLKPVLTLNYRYSREDYLRDQRDSARRRYLTRWVLNRNVIGKLLLSVLMCYALFTTTFALLRIVYAVIILLINFEHISAFTPILDSQMARMLRPVLALRPAQEATFTLFATRIRVVAELHYMEFTFSDIQAVSMLPHGVAIYLKSQTTLTVPGSPQNKQEDLEKIYNFIRVAKGWNK